MPDPSSLDVLLRWVETADARDQALSATLDTQGAAIDSMATTLADLTRLLAELRDEVRRDADASAELRARGDGAVDLLVSLAPLAELIPALRASTTTTEDLRVLLPPLREAAEAHARTEQAAAVRAEQGPIQILETKFAQGLLALVISIATGLLGWWTGQSP